MIVNKGIIKRLKTKDEQAFNLIYHEYYRLIFSIIYGIVKNREDTEDLMIETFQTIYLKIDMLKKVEVTSFKYWMLQIAKNIAKDFLKSKNRKPIIYDEQRVMAAVSQKDNQNLNDMINLIYNCLEEEEIDIVTSYLVSDFTFKEIAKINNSTVSIVHKKYQKAIDKIKKYMEGD